MKGPFISRRHPPFRCEAKTRMQFRSTRRRLPTAAGASLAVAVLLCAWQSKAEAGCRLPHGTPWRHAMPSQALGTAHLELLAETGILDFGFADRAPLVPNSPCAGLRCSDDPLPWGPNAPVNIAPGAEHWGCLRPPDESPASGAEARSIDEPAARPSHPGLSLFRPPRGSAALEIERP